MQGQWGSFVATNGPVAMMQRELLYLAAGIMICVVAVVIVLALSVAWRYRERRAAPGYDAEWAGSGRLELSVWAIPIVLIAVLGALVWHWTRRLDPYDAVGPKPGFVVQAVALDWKWLFIYPAEGVAVINELALPTDRNVEIDITSDAVMGSFFVPALAGQIYAMPGMQTRLNLVVDSPRRMLGRNAQYSGSGFPEQWFDVLGMSADEFDQWVEETRTAPDKLDLATYQALRAPTRNHPHVHYGEVESDLFARILDIYRSTSAAREDANN